ncbi:MAG: LysE family translocator [Pseudonocardiales bacterium]|nr:LysE family translocator [Actinomycetota bacterium]
MSLAVVTFAAAAALLILVPGPDNALVIRNALRGGRRSGQATAAGVLTGLLLWAAAAALGLSALLQASRIGYDILRYAGAVYLIWLGMSSLRTRRSPGPVGAQSDGPPAAVRRAYLTGVTTNLFNPKVGIFFITFLPAFIPHGAPVGATSVLFGAMFVLETAAWFALLLWLVGRGSSWLAQARVQRRLERVTGVVLIGFGLRLATERR